MSPGNICHRALQMYQGSRIRYTWAFDWWYVSCFRANWFLFSPLVDCWEDFFHILNLESSFLCSTVLSSCQDMGPRLWYSVQAFYPVGHTGLSNLFFPLETMTNGEKKNPNYFLTAKHYLTAETGKKRLAETVCNVVLQNYITARSSPLCWWSVSKSVEWFS